MTTPSPIGSCLLLGRDWLVAANPHVLGRLKRLFPRVNAEAGRKGELRIRRSPEIDRDLEWFMDRYPLEMGTADRAELARGAERHRADEEVVEAVQAGTYEPREFELAVTPRGYQRTAADLWLRLDRMLLGDSMGLGKTITALTGLSDPTTRPALVVMPTHLPEQWQSQIRRCFHDATSHIVQGTTPYDIVERTAKEAAKMSLFRGAPPPRWPDFVLCPYSRLAGWAPALSGRFASVVADEVQELRHTDSQRYAAFRQVADPARRVLGMSGTPIFNYGGEFWNPLDAIRPDCLGSKEEFAREWCNRDGEERKWTLKSPQMFGEHIRKSGIFLARTRADVGAELPPFTLIPHTCPTDHKALDRVSGRAVELAKLILSQKLGGAGSGFDSMRQGSELDRIMRQATGVAKAPYIADFLRMVVESGEPVICAAWHREVYAILEEKLADLAPAFYTGAETPKQKQEALRRFIKGETPIFIMSLRSGAGIDGLQTMCRTAVIAEPDWSPAVHDQFFMRLDRDGQAKETMGYFLLAESGSDPTVADVCGAKAANYRPVLRPGATAAEYQIDPAHTRRLAESILKRGVR